MVGKKLMSQLSNEHLKPLICTVSLKDCFRPVYEYESIIYSLAGKR
jgi:hypothetical protein